MKPSFRRKTPTRRSQKTGQPPGALLSVAEAAPATTSIRVHRYTATEYSELDNPDSASVHPFEENAVVWIDITGLADLQRIDAVGQSFGLHPLVIEDLINTEQRPKAEDHEDYVFLVGKCIRYDAERRDAEFEHVAIVLGKSFVLTVHNTPLAAFQLVESRLRDPRGRLRRRHGAELLFHALTDTMVDEYFYVLERMEDAIEVLEEEVLHNRKPTIIQDVHALTTELREIRKIARPLREALLTVENNESELLTEGAVLYMRDVVDHASHIMESADACKDSLAEILDVHFAQVNFRMSETMKFLAVMSTIFIPLTFIAGVYGMNFHFMPELNSPWGYPGVLSVMGLTAVGFLVFFRRKGWI